jgi:hypothetical protein
MLLSQFYQKLLPPNGIYSLLTVDNKTHYWATSIEDLVEATQALGDRTDIYFAPASFLKVGTAMGGRKQSDVDQLQCFKLDLDAGEKKLKIHGPEKVYVTQADAIKAVVEFTKETKLMFSLLVSSGEGLHVIRMPEHYGALSPILHVVPLQLLSYHTACARGTDVDKPRNLAKSVTVE